MEEIWVYLLKGFGALAGLAFYEWVRKIRQNAKNATYVKNHSPEVVTEIDNKVRHETRKIRDRYLAMRCYVIHFSNGTVTDVGLPLRKITFKHEAYIDWGNRSVLPVSKNFQEVEMPQMFLSPMSITFKAGEYYLKNRKTLNIEDSSQVRDYYYWLELYGVESTMWLGIYKKNNIAAILVCHWPQPTDLSGTIISDIKEIKRNIEKIYAEIK